MFNSALIGKRMREIWDKTRQNGLKWFFKKLLIRPLTIFFNRFVELVLMFPAMVLCRISALRPRTQNQIVFVCDGLHIRIARMACALREKGWNVILLHKDPLQDWQGELFDVTKRYMNKWHALWIGAQYTPTCYHILAGWVWRFETAHIFVKHKPGKIIIDPMDVLTGMLKEDGPYYQKYRKQMELEQFCYKFADGLCTRSISPQVVKRQGFRLPKNILFPEYCWPPGRYQRQPRLKDGIHIVQSGSVNVETEYNTSYEFDLAIYLSKAKIHIHFYPKVRELVPLIRKQMADRLKKEGDPMYVHIHDTLTPPELARELSQYHFGLLISTGNSTNLTYDVNSENWHMHFNDNFCSAKIWDYLEAGLFILHQNGRFREKIVDKCNLGKVVRSFEEIVVACRDKRNVPAELPKQYYVSNNVNRLIDFYSSVAISGRGEL